MYHGPLLNSFLSFNGPLCGPDYETPPLMDTRAIIHWLSYFWPLMVPLIYVDHSSNGQSVQKPLLLGTKFFFFFGDIDFFMCHAQEADIDILGEGPSWECDIPAFCAIPWLEMKRLGVLIWGPTVPRIYLKWFLLYESTPIILAIMG